MTRRHGRAPSQRQLRVGEELRHALARILERGDIRDPDLANRVVTITEVRPSPDLRNATVFVVPLGGGDSKPIIAALKRVKSYLRGQIAQQLPLKFAPDLSFQPDSSFEQATRIDGLLRSVHPYAGPDAEFEDADIETESGEAGKDADGA